MGHEALDEVLRKRLHNVRSEVRIFVYNVAEHVMLDLLSKDGIGKTLNAHTEKYFDNDRAAEMSLNRSLTSQLIWAPMMTNAILKPDSAMDNKKCCVAFE